MARAYSQPVTDNQPLRMSYDEWRAWYGREERNRGEWVRGEVIPYMPPLMIHVQIAGFLYGLMYFYARHRGLGDVFNESAELWLPNSQSSRLPDISFMASQHADRLTTHRLDGYADLVVEIISPDSVTRDRRQKFAEYQDAGIPEYWIIDPRPRWQTVTVFALGADGRYKEVAAPESGQVRSRVLTGFWIDPAWLWQDPLPDPYQIMQDLIAEAER